MALELNHVFGQFFGNHKMIGNLTGEKRIPERREGLRRGLLAHDFHNIGRCNGSGIGETIQQRSNAKKMVSVAVGNIDRCQIFSLLLTQPARASACSTVMKASTRTASRLP